MVQPQQMGQQKKGLGVWVWVAIGCVGLLMLGGLAVGGAAWWGARKVKSMVDSPTAAIEMIAAMNPDIEVVDRDPAAGTVTIRDKNSGETMTVDMDDVKDGNISFKTDEGTTSLSMDQEAGKVEVRGADGALAQFGGSTQLPGWVPSYPGGTSEGVYTAQDAASETGTFTMSTTDTLDAVFGFYKAQLESGGYKVSENRFSSPDGDGATLMGEQEDGRRSLMFNLSTADGKTQVMGTYSQKKG